MSIARVAAALSHGSRRVWRAVAGERRAPATLTVSAEPEAALLASAAALRRLGARITRYDTELAALEARHHDDVVRLTVSTVDGDTSKLHIASDGATARSLVRRFRTELSRPSVDRR
ncbi:MAG: hypothetical protein HYU41_10790 [Candidatus Rokubacteria bacterium]|nr:hypothetical protein [Candidatus Rokubacteria bacterium]